jgi:predicted restriction endonuclease
VPRPLSPGNANLLSLYRLLGLGLVEGFDAARDLFRIRGVAADRFTDYLGIPLQDDLIETALRLESLEDWQPFVREDRVLYRVNAQRRDDAFRDVVLDNYDKTCAVTGQRFVYSDTIEAHAAHIIGKEFRGTDDPRNGLAMSRSVHWAFDNGIFTISDQYEVIIHPEAKKASINAFPLFEKDRKQILLPSDPAYRPHPDALARHRKERFGQFSKG